VHVFRSTRYNFGSLLEYYCATIHSGRAGYIRSTTSVVGSGGGAVHHTRTDRSRYDLLTRYVALRITPRQSVKVVRRNRVADLTSVVGVTIE